MVDIRIALSEENDRLIDEITTLRAEIERLKVELEQCQQTLYRQIGLTIEASEEATKASATEIERLRAALREIAELPGEINHSNYNHEDVVALNNSFCEAFHIARAALEGGR